MSKEVAIFYKNGALHKFSNVNNFKNLDIAIAFTSPTKSGVTDYLFELSNIAGYGVATDDE